MLKVSENPPVIWPQEKSVIDFAGTWWVAHTKSRNEKALAWQLQSKDINYFLPMTWKVARSRGRTLRSLLPIFTGYLFFCGNEAERIELLRTNRIANLLAVKDQAGLIADLWPIEKLIRQGQPLVPHQYLKTGQKCRVIAGALAGIEGIVVTVSRQTRLVLQVQMLGQATSVEIDTDMIEPVD